MAKPISVRVVDALRDGPMSESALLDVLHIDRISDSIVTMQLTSLVASRTIQKTNNMYSLYPMEDDEGEDGGAAEVETEQTVHRSETMTVRKRGRPPKTVAALAETNAQPPALPTPTESEAENDIGIFNINHVLKLQDVDGKVHRIEMTSEKINQLSISLAVLTSSPYFEQFM